MPTALSLSRRIRSNRRSMAAFSSDAVGSSRIRKRAPTDSARAISTTWRCSTLRSRASRLTSRSKPQSSMTWRARDRMARQSTKLRLAPVARLRKTFSATVRLGTTMDFW